MALSLYLITVAKAHTFQLLIFFVDSVQHFNTHRFISTSNLIFVGSPFTSIQSMNLVEPVLLIGTRVTVRVDMQ